MPELANWLESSPAVDMGIVLAEVPTSFDGTARPQGSGKVAAIADVEGHHPDLHIAWGKCKIEIWTHKIQGLTESDFYFAAKAERASSRGHPSGCRKQRNPCAFC